MSGVSSGDQIDATLRALADPIRRRAVELLSETPHRAGDLAQGLNLPAATMSKHLRVLLDAGIVVDERPAGDARVRVFRLRAQSVAGLRAWLDQLQAHWDEQLESFKAHVEGRGRR
jgi:DNA-binding transcriptional ArsR family regulator